MPRRHMIRLIDRIAPLRRGSFYLRITSLLALALVEPTQYVTQDVNIPDTCPAM